MELPYIDQNSQIATYLFSAMILGRPNAECGMLNAQYGIRNTEYGEQGALRTSVPPVIWYENNTELTQIWSTVPYSVFRIPHSTNELK
jgi:hypothetical protein